MARQIPPRRVPRDRFLQGGGSPGGIFGGRSVPGAHTHLEAHITDLDKFSQAAADARFAAIVHTHLEADITDLDKYSVAAADAAFAALVHTHLEADITDLGTYSVVGHTHLEADITDLQAYLVSPLTTNGDVLYYNAGHQRLAKGSDTEVLTLAAGVPTWAAPAGGGVTDHGALTGLGDDDHAQYAKLAGDTFTGEVDFTSSNTRFTHADPAIIIKQTGGAADEKVWRLLGRANQLQISTLNDAESVTATAMIFSRNGTTISDIEMWGNVRLYSNMLINRAINGESSLSIGEASTPRGDSQDGKLYIYGETSSALTVATLVSTGSNLQIGHSTGFIQMQSSVDILSGSLLRVRDSGNSDYGEWSHDGTDFVLTLTGTTNYKITGANNLKPFMSIKPGTNSVYDLGQAGLAWRDLFLNGNVMLTDSGSVIQTPNTAGGSVWAPGGANHYASTSSKTGAIRIQIPNDALADMLSFTVVVFDYTTSASFTVQVTGYANTSGGSGGWNNVSAHIIQDPHSSENYTVRFGHDGTNHIVYIGELASTWSYPQVQVFNFMSGYTTTILNYENGWDVTWRTGSFEDLDETLTDVTVGAGGGGISVTVSTSAASGGGSDGDLWCRI